MPDHAYSLIVEVWSQNIGSKIILGEKVCGSAKVFSSKKGFGSKKISSKYFVKKIQSQKNEIKSI